MGDIVKSKNQLGGITAHIVNVNPNGAHVGGDIFSPKRNFFGKLRWILCVLAACVTVLAYFGLKP